ncbi:D-alanyl-D-alanine carboxypeptidase/D-alanyl-D-alanine-endopeptidase [uncultured Methanospirillum sp.]|uniref:D-alanyl-D-alanine carboxypeptidase/D-alanyl-D-alanine endopeptidase n=1 Tax=uncultured Methanospirillum sp. TaxID=262503 RepID=UPI0029C8B0DE|nr:D-alanyl-D-alanine carboxypeptidase/D-alanyl-D-alanine-endopeptidase [uncultured Methanospirillum sp.]
MTQDPSRWYMPGVIISILVVLILVSIGSFGTASQTTPDSSVFEKKITAITSEPRFSHASWGLIIVDPVTGQTLYEKNADEMFVPASTTKIFSSSAVLAALGPDYQIKTPVYAEGVIETDGNLDGNLVLVAKGDMTMGGRTLPDGTIEFRDTDHSESGGSLTTTDPLAGLDDLSKQVKAAGITKVSDVIIDDRLFENIKGEYMALLSPIVINDNMVDLSVTPGEPGSAPSVVMRPQTSLYLLDNRVTTGPAGTKTTLDAGEEPAGTIVVVGTIAADAGTVNTTAAITNPAVFTRTLFIEALKRQGVDVVAQATGDNPVQKLPGAGNYGSGKKVAELTSPPLVEDVKLTLKVSQNMHANYYIMLLALSENKTSFSDGMTKEGEVLRSFGLDTTGVMLGDGAGGDRVDHVSPHTAAQLLDIMSEQPYADRFIKALPILGVDGSAVHHCAAENPACGRVYAKTGTYNYPDPLNGDNALLSKGLAGYVDTRSGKRLVFVEYVNNVRTSENVTADSVGTDLGTIAGMIYENY